MATLDHITKALHELLEPEAFQDYCPNGLQVEGKPEVGRLVTGVTANQAFIDQAIATGADAVLVHHGFFWRGEPEPLVGLKGKRIRALIQNGISLLAYHLPLDAHPELGNNRQLANRLGIAITTGLQPSAQRPIGNIGSLPEAVSAQDFAQQLTQVLGREPLHIPGDDKPLQRIGFCTGAAQGYFEQAIDQQVDVYLTGEISEQTVHLARESGVHFFACGHHATERYGVQAVGDWLAARFGIEHVFIDIDNPV